MKKKIKGIIFDYGGVISKDQDQETVKEMLSILGIDANNFKNIYQQLRHDYDAGLLNGKQYWNKFLEICNIQNLDNKINDLIELDIKSWTQINEKTTNFIQSLKESNLKIGLLSNMSIETLAYLKNNFRIFDNFDNLTFSCELNLCKPGLEIYKISYTNLNLQPEECVFIDDTFDNIIAAEKAGLNTIHFTNYEDFLDKLNKHFYWD